ncbi:hypothetical protein ACEZCY_11070 [Streptacidiphilus sp. N1-12]|uniref:Uncharacterized protein n=2 Tax=Streptacidiphilus alkalitolerans TaxID=3342712 RepID=A0ABV6V6F9_9ACTN
MILPHGPYFTAVMTALGHNADPTESWAAYDSDNGETMLMEIVIGLDPQRAAARGFTDGLIILWSQVTGWEWAYMLPTGFNSEPKPLLWGDVPTPDSIAHATTLLLDTRAPLSAVPTTGTETPDDPAITLTPDLAAALDENNADTLRRLAHYTRTSAPGTTSA